MHSLATHEISTQLGTKDGSPLSITGDLFEQVGNTFLNLQSVDMIIWAMESSCGALLVACLESCHHNQKPERQIERMT